MLVDRIGFYNFNVWNLNFSNLSILTFFYVVYFKCQQNKFVNKDLSDI